MAGRNKSPVQQAWEYAMDAKGAQWVLVSNYREIRLYAVGYGRKEYESFELSSLRKPEDYARFILLLSAQNLLSGKTLSLLKESEKVEKDITDQLYADYKILRHSLIDTIGKDNPEKDTLDVIRYTQTILDRILFVAFAEDKGLLPDKTLEKAYETQNPFNPQPVWENFKGLFQAINKGNATLNIPGYNGGLFADDPDLNSLNISNELCEYFKKIGEYDFQSEISVNILGHIFEQSITDLEELKAEANGSEAAFDKKKSKRKKDGIFYTPSYITRYIVEQAVGGWLADKRKEIGFEKLPVLSDDDFASIKMVVSGRGKNKTSKIVSNKNIAAHIAAWGAYKEALSQIKVLDPACGSGAFLNEVFDYLKNEGQTINNELARLTGEQTDLFRWDTHILANNIYGVDLNRESVEITKLSLWLKTANRNEKLTYLENNIKVGNSLIDDLAIAGDLAFDWHKEFADIMNAGGFDVVVGNPPYGASLNTAEKNYIKARYTTTEYNFDTYISFFELAVNVIKNSAYLGYITPNTFLVTENSTKIRSLLLADNTLISLLEVFNVFPDAVVEPIVAVIKKSTPNKNHTFSAVVTPRRNIDFSQKIIQATTQTFSQPEIVKANLIFNYRAQEIEALLAKKIDEASTPLSDHFIVTTGIKPYQNGKGTPPQTASIVKDKPYTGFSQHGDDWLPLIRGTDITRYSMAWTGEYIHYGSWLAEPRTARFFAEEKLFIRRTDDSLMACYDDTGMVGTNSIHTINPKPSTAAPSLMGLLGLINSKLINWHFRHKNFHMVGKPLAEVKVVFVERLPINISAKLEIQNIGDKATILTDEAQKLFALNDRFLRLIQSEFLELKPSRNLSRWYMLAFKDFVAELEKAHKLTLSQKSEWMQHFEAEKSKALALKTEIDRLDCEIDQMVYALYGLTPDEIEIVESSSI